MGRRPKNTTIDGDIKDLSVIKALSEMAPGTIIDEEAICEIFNRHVVSVKRAVERGELPPPVRLFGRPCWTVEHVLAHVNARLQAALEETRTTQKRVRRHQI